MKPLDKMTPYELGESGDQKAIEYLIRYLQSEKYNEKRLAASALEKLIKRNKISILAAKPYLLKNSGDPKPQIRQYSLKALLSLSQHLSPSDLTILRKYLNTEDKEYNIALLKRIRQSYNKQQTKKEKTVKSVPKTNSVPGSNRPITKSVSAEIDPNSQIVIVILAKSRKYGGYCIAGKIINGENPGRWVRPVSNHEHGEITFKHIQYADGNNADLLDIVSIPILRATPRGYQSENVLIDETKRWVKVGGLKSEKLDSLGEKLPSLWINRYRSSMGRNDRIPCDRAEKEIRTSLCLVKANDFNIIVQDEYNKKKVRAEFVYNKIKYKLVVTDHAIERYYKKKEFGTYSYAKKTIYLCISMGETFEGFCYKLVAAVLSI